VIPEPCSDPRATRVTNGTAIPGVGAVRRRSQSPPT